MGPAPPRPPGMMGGGGWWVARPTCCELCLHPCRRELAAAATSGRSYWPCMYACLYVQGSRRRGTHRLHLPAFLATCRGRVWLALGPSPKSRRAHQWQRHNDSKRIRRTFVESNLAPCPPLSPFLFCFRPRTMDPGSHLVPPRGRRC